MNNLKKPLVSVLVAIYKVEKYLPKCLDSIIGQSYDRLEIILVNDGTPDSSGKIADQYAVRDERMRIIHKENGGISNARNAGLDKATGEYIVFVDGDDYLAPDFVEYMLKLAGRTGAEIVMSKNCFTTGDDIQIDSDSVGTITPEEFMLSYLYPRTRIGVWNKMFKRDLIERHQLRFRPEATTGEGMAFITFTSQHTESVGVGERKVYHYRTNNNGSATTKPDVERQGIGSLENLNYIMKNMTMETPRLRKAFEWHKWACYRYILQNIIGAKEQKKYLRLYKESKRQIRALLAVALLSEAPTMHKLRAILTAVNPIIMLKVELARRNHRLKLGKSK